MKILYDDNKLVCSVVLEETDSSYNNIRSQLNDGQFVNQVLIPNLLAELQTNQTLGFMEFAAGEREFEISINVFKNYIDIRLVKASVNEFDLNDLLIAGNVENINREYLVNEDNELLEVDNNADVMDIIQLAASAFWFETLDDVIRVSKLLAAGYDVYKDNDDYGIIYRCENTADEMILSEYSYETEYIENENMVAYFMEHHEPITNTEILKGIA